MYKDSSLLSQNIDNLFSIKYNSDIITVNSDGTSDLQLRPNIVMTFLHLLKHKNLESMIKLADDFNLKKEQTSSRTKSLFISHNNKIVNSDEGYCYIDPYDIYPLKGDDNQEFNESITIDFIEHKPVCIRFNINIFDKNSTTYIRYMLPVGLGNNGKYIINGIAKVHYVCDLETIENYFEEYKYVSYNNCMIDYSHQHDIKITSMAKKVNSEFDNDKSYLTNYY